MTLEDALALQEEAEGVLQDREFEVSGGDVLRLVAQSPCSAYDWEFVALARSFGITLVTTDRKLVAAFPDVAVLLSDIVGSHQVPACQILRQEQAAAGLGCGGEDHRIPQAKPVIRRQVGGREHVAPAQERIAGVAPRPAGLPDQHGVELAQDLHRQCDRVLREPAHQVQRGIAAGGIV